MIEKGLKVKVHLSQGYCTYGITTGRVCKVPHKQLKDGYKEIVEIEQTDPFEISCDWDNIVRDSTQVSFKIPYANQVRCYKNGVEQEMDWGWNNRYAFKKPCFKELEL